MDDLSTENTLFAGIIGGTFMWVRYFCFDQVQVQRVLTAKSIKGVKSSLASSAILMNVTYFIILLIGMFLWVFYGGKEFADTNQIMINFILNELPIGLTGLIVSGGFAAAMSSVDSILNSMTTVFIKDIYEEYFYKGEEEVPLKTTMLITLLLGIFIIIFVIIGFSGTVASVLDTVGNYISFLAGPAAGSFILAMFTLKANDKGVATGFVVGFAINYIISIILSPFWLWNAFIGGILTIVIGYVFSLIFKSDKDIEDIRSYTAMGMRNDLLADDAETMLDREVSMVPFELDKYGVIVLVFFFLQFPILFLMM
jgi:Na+/proline symporter